MSEKPLNKVELHIYHIVTLEMLWISLFAIFRNAVADAGFPKRGPQAQRWGANLLLSSGGGARQLSGGRQHTILPNFPKNCMKLKEFGPLLDACDNFCRKLHVVKCILNLQPG